MEVIGVLVVVFLGVVLYFVPWMVAASRKHRNTTAIFALNFLLGWTIIGWIAAFVWSLTN